MNQQIETLSTYNGTWDREGQEKRREANKSQKCANCGKSFKHPHQYYCSEKCANEFFFAHHGGIWSEFRKEVLRRDGQKCRRCGQDGNEVDHIIELDRGGTNKLSNLQTLCHKCHAIKTASYIRKKWRKQEVTTITVNPDDYLLRVSQMLMTEYTGEE